MAGLSMAEVAAVIGNRKKGTFFTATIRRFADTRNGVKAKVEKVTQVQGMKCDYFHRKPVRDAIESGMCGDRLTRPSHFGQEVDHLGVRFWNGNNHHVYLPIVLSGNAPRITWYVNGKETPYEDVDPLLTAPEKRPLPTVADTAPLGQAPFICVNLNHLVSIR